MEATQTLSEKDKEILKRALELEDNGKDSWTWWEVKAFPAELMRLVIAGYVEVVEKSPARRKPAKYRLTNKDLVRRLVVK